MDQRKIILDYLIKERDSFYRIVFFHIHNESDSYDIVSEATLKALTKSNSLKDINCLKPWFYRILINCMYSNIKKNKRIYQWDDSLGENVIAPSSDISINDKITIKNSINILKPKYKTLIVLRYYEDLTFQEISNILHLPQSTIKSQLKKALSILKKEVSSHE